ncbi:MAG: DUF4174 domain-containing protein [Pseudomonadota bacterium]
MTRLNRFLIPAVGLVASAFLAALGALTPASAQDVAADAPTPQLQIMSAADVTLEEFRWVNRLVVVFADTPADPRFNEQIELLTSRPSELIERDVIILTDTDPGAATSVRTALRPRGFQITLIGKDGEVELRKPSPWSSRELSRSIDKMPLRKQEIRERKAQAG